MSTYINIIPIKKYLSLIFVSPDLYPKTLLKLILVILLSLPLVYIILPTFILLGKQMALDEEDVPIIIIVLLAYFTMSVAMIAIYVGIYGILYLCDIHLQVYQVCLLPIITSFICIGFKKLNKISVIYSNNKYEE